MFMFQDNAVYALNVVWHRDHLVCCKCGAGVGVEHRPFVAGGADMKEAVCLDCYMESKHLPCVICNLPLFETCIKNGDGKRMHRNCFVCEKCKAPFEGEI